MKIDEYLETLPENLLSGEDVQLSEKSLRSIFKFVELKKDDVFYHLGCGDEKGIDINYINDNGENALIWCRKYPEILKLLIEKNI